ncbi:aminotransferase DegT [Amycolatopsis albispora]|uniref:Aminotransferase DegT n=2 Tax=Amycolatopsis albispora TaxID=1804986 RepID=A0A344LIY1_9PSEU|nr:DegT/DnrJ/EryC1/StrS family aminotransferase [Amycolatopsis albispora]AXB48005.1 aminotransferase DegT [Amycolatopsis albispora]
MLDEPRQTRAEVRFFAQNATFERLWPLIRARVGEVFDNGKFSHGKQVAQLEQRLREYTGAQYVVGVNSGTDALVLLLRAAGLKPGDGVIVPAFSFVATASAVVLAGGVPQFADIDPGNYALNPGAIETALTPASRFVLPAHLFTSIADMASIREIAGRNELTVLEDSAEGIGMRQRGIHSGLHGKGGVLSFFPSKTLGALGDAGAVLTNDPGIAGRVAALRHHGRGGRTLDHFPGISTESGLIGTNSKMDDIQAAILLAKLTCLDEDIARRRALALEYGAGLAGIPGIRRRPELGPDDVCYVYLIEADRRDELAAYLAEAGIGTETYYPIPLHRQPCFAEFGPHPDLPHAEAACARALALPLYPDLEARDVHTVCAHIRRFYAEVAA